MNQRCIATKVVNDVQKAINTGSRMLAIREHSEKQIRTKLINKGYSQHVINETITHLIAENWLSESRFCNVFIRSKVAKGQGLMRIVLELKQQNISQSIIETQLEVEDINWQQVCDNALLKKIRYYAIENNDSESWLPLQKTIIKNNKEKVKLENFLRYRGFSSEQIKVAIESYLLIKHYD